MSHPPSDPDGPDVLILERWTGPITPGDPHANFKREVAAGSLVDPLPTLVNLATFVGLPVGAVPRGLLGGLVLDRVQRQPLDALQDAAALGDGVQEVALQAVLVEQRHRGTSSM